LTIGRKQAIQLVLAFLEAIALELQDRLDLTMTIKAFLVGYGQLGQGNNGQHQPGSLQQQPEGSK